MRPGLRQGCYRHAALHSQPEGPGGYIGDARRCFVCYNCERLCPVDAIVMNDEKPPDAFFNHMPVFAPASPGAGEGRRTVLRQRQHVLVVGAGDATGTQPALARAYGGYGVHVREPQRLGSALRRAPDETRGGWLALVDVVLSEQGGSRG